MLDVEKLIAGVHDYIGRALAPFARRIKALEDRSSERGEKGEPGAIGERGPQGIQGERGEKGEPGAIGERGPQGIQGERGEKGDAGIAGKDGAPGLAGINGKDAIVDYDRIGVAIKEVVAVAVDEIPRPKDGKDGASIHPDTVALMVRNAVDAAVNTMQIPAMSNDRGSDDISEMAKAFIAGLVSEESRV